MAPTSTSFTESLPKAYDPAAIEEKWSRRWVDERLFDVKTPASASKQETFAILLPPPNVTGRLHMGHMFEQTEMDVQVRWQRMRGKRALWVPGSDHAGIATQMLVERQLKAEGLTREELGRVAFTDRVWQWKEHYGGAIQEQMKRLGVSVDWSREYFTMDEGLSKAVREAFVRLYEQGLIYRGAYIVNWCPSCRTAISDLEVVHEEQQGKLYEIRYPLTDGSGSIVIATTRPETMLGDVAVAVNPDDPRYAAFHGKTLRLPLMEREIPIVTDSWANPEFGTGAVKVTPAHDPNDFAIGLRHKLPSISIMDDSARINSHGGAYAGLDRYEARARILADLEARGLLVATKDHTHAIGKCDRCKTIVEPRLSTQWFVKIQPLADKAIAAVEQGFIRFVPEQHARTYFEWMRNIHDWCISRQLWWGHRIPAWHCAKCHEITVARETPPKCAHCGSSELTQENDVLDTWFSSGLLPFSVFGWPEQTADLAAFYPTQLLITGFDILFFWVARMIMLGCHFMSDMPMPDGSPRTLKDSVPFREVHIHALVRDADRQKMSKTKGNVIDPIEIITRYGTDAVRFTLAAMASPGTDIAFSEARTEGYRAFANKIWNAARFIFMQIGRASEAGIAVDMNALPDALKPAASAPLESRWIVGRLNQTVAQVEDALAEFRFHEAANLVYQFFWGDFCDWYLEIIKLRLEFEASDKKSAEAALLTLVAVFEAALRMLSPFMPFISEELWHALYSGNPPADSIALTAYPQAGALDAAAVSAMSQLQELIGLSRALRKELDVPEKQAVPLFVYGATAATGNILGNADIVQRLARVSSIEVAEAKLEGANARHLPGLDIAIEYEKQIDPVAERERLSKDLARFEKEAANAQRQLSNDAFLAKAPGNVIEGIRARSAELDLLLSKTRTALAALDGK
jgi:valyl-tRNA synthetase